MSNNSRDKSWEQDKPHIRYPERENSNFESSIEGLLVLDNDIESELVYTEDLNGQPTHL